MTEAGRGGFEGLDACVHCGFAFKLVRHSSLPEMSPTHHAAASS